MCIEALKNRYPTAKLAERVASTITEHFWRNMRSLNSIGKHDPIVNNTEVKTGTPKVWRANFIF